MKQVFESHGLSENYEIAQEILQACSNERIFAFFGNLGAGKTTLIKAFCSVLGVETLVSSPTFTLIHEYMGKHGPVYHFDFYRLKSAEEGYGLGCEEYFYSGAYCFIEWPERLESLLPDNRVEVRLSQLDDSTKMGRLIEVYYGEGTAIA
ncbi:MAG: tRNA (adenosine(37)-N6)-threonylcarbamoyltransferase complex ATPase subunit type 1 TsaE [Bacteroidota bacterium]